MGRRPRDPESGWFFPAYRPDQDSGGDNSGQASGPSGSSTIRIGTSRPPGATICDEEDQSRAFRATELSTPFTNLAASGPLKYFANSTASLMTAPLGTCGR